MAGKAWTNFLYELPWISYHLMHTGIPVLGVGYYKILDATFGAILGLLQNVF